MKICVVVPVFNEEKLLEANIGTIMSYVVKLPVFTKVIVINDGSADSSGRVLEQLKVIYPPSTFEVISHTQNKGYGAAQRTGVDFAVKHGFDHIIFMDSDLTNHPRYLNEFCKKMFEGYDYIKATRYGPGAGTAGVPLSRRLVSLYGNKVAKLLFGLPLHDLTNGFRSVKTNILSKIKLTEDGFAIIVEELYLCKPLVRSYAEIPYILTSRSRDGGRTHFTYDFKTYSKYLKYAFKGAFAQRPYVQK